MTKQHLAVVARDAEGYISPTSPNNQLADLVKQGESATLEFKKSTAEKDRACRTLCAFANGQGGRTIERINLPNGHEALQVQVPRKGTPPYTYRGVPYERVLNTTRVMPRESHQRLIIESVHAITRWDNQPAAGWRADQLDQTEILATIEEAIRRGRCEDPGSRDPTSILRGLGLLLPDGALSRAAIALFCPDDVAPSDFPQFKLLWRASRAPPATNFWTTANTPATPLP